jgi:tetratricopeptide (TPR) repeat protein
VNSKGTALGLIFLGLSPLLRAEVAPPIQDNDTSPYHVALIDYKAGKFQDALDALKQGPPGGATPADAEKVVVLESKILTELKRYDDGEKLLRGLLTPAGPTEIQLALGDLLLRKRSFDRAAKYYALALETKPDDPDIILKLVYTQVGAGDLLQAGQYASRLSPIDPKNPYDDHASYYFAKAALAQSTGKTAEAESEIQTARTVYGVEVTNRYLKTYLEVLSSSAGPTTDMTPPPLLQNPAPK